MTNATQYNKIAIFLHWLIALLIIGQFAVGKIMEAMAPITLKFELYQWHKSFGITILLLSLARLAWRLTHKAPPLPADMNGLEKFAAKATHVLFYVLMIGVPVVGWAMVSASVYDIDTVLFKWIPWPHMPGIAQDKALEATLKQAHKLLSLAIAPLLLLHVAAALKHHIVNRDDVLTRMIPILKRPSPKD